MGYLIFFAATWKFVGFKVASGLLTTALILDFVWLCRHRLRRRGPHEKETLIAD